MITQKVWRCKKCRYTNKYREPGIMIITAGRDTCHKCGKRKGEESIFKLRLL